jgi:hypothetical protein
LPVEELITEGEIADLEGHIFYQGNSFLPFEICALFGEQKTEKNNNNNE